MAEHTYDHVNDVSEGTLSERLASLWHQILVHESALLIAIIFIAGGTWGFIAVAEEVTEGTTHAIDERIVLALRNPADLSDPIGSHWVEEFMRDFTAMGGVGVLLFLTIAVVGYLILQKKTHAAWLVFVTIAGGTLLSLLLKQGFDRPRPDLVPHGSFVATASFPSGHSMLSAATYLTLGALLARLQERRQTKVYILVLAVVLTILIGTSRIYLGVHWPTDVLAGWTAGAVWAALCWTVAWWLQQRGHVERPGPEPD